MPYELPVECLVRPDIVACSPATPVRQAAKSMSEAHCSSILVMDGERAVGIWTERDALCVDLSDTSALERPISEVMRSPVRTLHCKTPLGEAALRLREEGIRHFLVLDDDGKMLGLLTQTDVIQNMGVESYLSLKEVGSLVKGPPLVIPPALSLAQAAGRMRERDCEAAVVDFGGELGILTERDIVRAISAARADRTAGEIASRPLVSVPENASLYHARRLAAERSIRHLGVTGRGGALMGILAFSDLLASAAHEYVQELRQALQEFTVRLDAANAALVESEQRYRTLFNSSHDAIFLYALAPEGPGRFDEVNEMACRRLGYTREELLALSPCDIEAPECRGNPQAIAERLRSERQAVFDTEHVAKDGTRIPVEVSARLFDWQGQPHALAIARDVTERKQAEERMRRMAHFDALTDLPNRSLLLELLDQTLFAAKRYRRQFALLFVDLDRFKQINDTLGHHAGDQLLRCAADRLVECVRASDIVARFGGDEFIIVLTELGEARDAARVAEKIVAAMTLPILLDAETVTTTVSVGIAIHPADGEDIGALVRKADAAMYRAKEAGRNRWSFADERP